VSISGARGSAQSRRAGERIVGDRVGQELAQVAAAEDRLVQRALFLGREFMPAAVERIGAMFHG
jgi:hypothetical protein